VICLASMKKARVLMLLLACVSLISAESRQDNVAQKLVGAWRLVSVEGTDPTFHFAYDHPTGVIIYDRSGWMSVQIDIKGTRKPFVNGPAGGTGEEKVAAFDNYIAYYGTYTLDLKAQTVTHHLQDASPPNWRGVNNVRWFEFQGNDRLLLIPREDGKGGVIDRKNATFKLLWERIK
jgi:Lipocalin-like domain